MLSRAKRRSGIAFCKIMELLNWKPNTIFQVGVGIYFGETIEFLKCWPDVKLIGFEPNSLIVETVKDEYPGTILPYAISNKNGSCTLYNKKKHKDGSSLFKHLKHHDIEKYGEEQVEVKLLDSLFPNPERYGDIVLWLDCEGSELDVLEGSENFVKYVGVINVEMTAKPMLENQCDTVSLHNRITDLGYKKQWIHTQRSSQGQYDSIYVKDNLFDPEHCCCPFTIEKYRKNKES